VTIGSPCEITLDAFPSHPYRGTVETIVPTADRAKATILTKIRFLDRDERVLPEMSAKVAFLAEPLPETAAPRLAVPSAAVVKREGRSTVFVVRDARAVETPVETGSMTGQLVEVRSGLAAGDRVVLNPPESLKSGARVKATS
jgi:multidrug efflux pump subunit AcrA (membrane-fusion protein)